jgi:UPF0755 protein
VNVAEKADTLQAGDCVLSPSMTADELIAALGKGRAREVRFTIPEGLRKAEIARLIAKAGISSEKALLAAMNNPALARELGVPAIGAGGQASVPGGLEGYLFPDTYQFPKETPPEVIVRKLRARLDEVVDDEMRARMTEMGWSLHQALTLAAIIEKETGQPQERPHISSVFHNRLDADPPIKLQTDPTVIYGIRGFRGNIKRRHLQDPHPYNTYVHHGLPPGPIASPGLAALRAALWPDDNADIFFVSKNDGTHVFCPDLKCHEAAVQEWQIEYWRKKREGR